MISLTIWHPSVCSVGSFKDILSLASVAWGLFVYFSISRGPGGKWNTNLSLEHKSPISSASVEDTKICLLRELWGDDKREAGREASHTGSPWSWRGLYFWASSDPERVWVLLTQLVSRAAPMPPTVGEWAAVRTTMAGRSAGLPKARAPHPFCLLHSKSPKRVQRGEKNISTNRVGG